MLHLDDCHTALVEPTALAGILCPFLMSIQHVEFNGAFVPTKRYLTKSARKTCGGKHSDEFAILSPVETDCILRFSDEGERQEELTVCFSDEEEENLSVSSFFAIRLRLTKNVHLRS